MSVVKINGFRAPYRSLTLRTEIDNVVRRNGVLAMDGEVYISGSDVIIPPFTVIQEGMLIEKTTSTTIPFPTSISTPFYVTVSAPTPSNVDDLTFQYASSPMDVSSNETILAEYDGNEFRQMNLVSIDGVIRDNHQINVDLNTVGPKNGLTTSIDGSNYKNLKGTIVDRRGRTVRMDEDFYTPIIQADPAWDRCDRIIYRQPADSENRIGHRKLVIGGTFSTGSQTLFDTTFINNSLRNNRVVSNIDSSNNLHIFYTEGYGDSFNIYYTKYNSSRNTQLISPLSISSCSSEYISATVDGSDNIHLVFIDGVNVKYIKLDSLGSVIVGPLTVDNTTSQCDRPKIVVDSLDLKLYIVYQNRIGPSNNQIYFTTRSLSGALITSPKKLTNTTTDLGNPSIAVSSDLIVYIAYEDYTNESIYYLAVDDIGTSYVSSTLISANTGSTSYGTLINQAKNPVVGFSDNKTLIIAYLQKKTISSYGLTIHENGSSFMPNLLSPSENFNAFDFELDGFMNELHVIVAQSSRLDYVKISGLTTVFSVQLNTAGAYDVQVLKDIWGSLVHSWSLPLSLTFTNAGATQSIDNIGPGVVAGTLNNLVLTDYECSFLVASLTYTPSIGERLEVIGSPTNNGFYIISGVRVESIDTSNDTLIVTCETAFTDPELASSSTAQFATPDGNEAHFVKSVAEKDKTRGLRIDVLDTDILLTRCLFPGPILLNYFSGSTPAINSDLFGMFGAIDVDWGASTANALTMTSGSYIVDLVTYFTYTVTGGTFPMSNGDALYVILDGVTSPVTPQVTPIVSLPWGLPIQVLGFVEAGEFAPHLFSVAGMGQLSIGEEIVLGEDLSKILRQRLGITSETSYQAYTSTNLFNLTDNYPTALSKLDDALNAVITDHALEEEFVVGAGGETTFTVSTFTFDPDNSRPDIQVFVNDRRAKIDPAGGTAKDYIKTSDDTIEFSFTIPEGSEVLIRQERTGGTLTGPGGGTDLTNVTVDVQPITNAAYSLGSATKAWKGIFIKDKVTSQVYELEVVSGIFAVEPRP